MARFAIFMFASALWCYQGQGSRSLGYTRLRELEADDVEVATAEVVSAKEELKHMEERCESMESSPVSSDVQSRFLQTLQKLKAAWSARAPARVVAAAKEAYTKIRSIMESWLTRVMVEAGDGKWQSLVNTIRDHATMGFISLQDFLEKIWGIMKSFLRDRNLRAKMGKLLTQINNNLRGLAKKLSGRGGKGPNADADAGVENADIPTLPKRRPAWLGRFLPGKRGAAARARSQSAVGAGGESAKSLQRSSSAPVALLEEEAEVRAFVPPETKAKLVVDKYTMLVLSVIVDLVGMSSYAADVIAMMGETVVDAAWAPLQALWLLEMFDGSKTIAAIGFLEEALPFMDVVPTASLAWLFSYMNVIGFGPIRTLLSLPDRTEVGLKPCSESVYGNIQKKYEIVKDNKKGHLYLQCKGGKKRHKASCVEDECTKEHGWCFVDNSCGGLKKGRCQEIFYDPIPCDTPSEDGDTSDLDIDNDADSDME
eukprot:TRINITY_DN16029_c0_g1_i1.p1 TRINITY_DN16029_c0_g1~~TRINITY_DN16029_c0_g1_i1.p1  ORF type:complete len:504 (+),score=128.97 TRINITY_DN16029_c0_g1_i1:66-1514(+)